MQAPQPDKTKKSFMWKSLPFFIFAHATHHILTALPQPLLPYIQAEFGLNNASSAGVTSAFSLSSAAAQLPAGWAADRLGPAILITLGTAGVAIGGFAVGLSHTYVMLIVAMVFMGLMAGGYHPAATPLISASVPANLRGRALGIHLVGGNSSFFLAPIIAVTIATVWNWRGSFIAMAIPTFILGFFFYIYLTRRGGKAHVAAARSLQVDEKMPQPGYMRRLVAFLILMVIGGGAGASVNAFLTLYMVNELHVSKELAGMSLMIIYSSGLWAGPVGGYISDKIGSVKVIIVTGIIGGLIIFALNAVSWGFWLFGVLWVMGLVQAIRFPVTEVFIMNQTRAKNRSTVYGIYYSTMQYTGAIFAPVMGIFIDRFGYHTMFNFSAFAVTAVALVTAIFIWDAKD